MLRFLLLLLLGASFAYQLALNRQSYALLAEPETVPRVPFSVELPGGKLSAPDAAASAAGLREGDILTAVEGKPVTGWASIPQVVRNNRPGDELRVTVQRESAITVPVILGSRARDIGAGDWVFFILFGILTPWLALLLGFGVAVIRVTDVLAWLLLGLMLSFAHLAGSDSSVAIRMFPPEWLQPADFFHNFLLTSWPLWMMLFGQYFPDRQVRGRWNPLLRAALGAPLLLLSVAHGALSAAQSLDMTALPWLGSALAATRVLYFVLMFAGISVFFSNLGWKLSTTTTDNRRRLRLLYFGAMVALSPVGVLVVISVATGRPLATFPPQALVPCLLLMLLFPATLTYVIVIERAMDLRVVLRQGVRYALATRGVRITQAIVTLIILTVLFASASDPNMRRPARIQIVAAGVAAVGLLQALAQRVQRWVDTYFFRDAVATEKGLDELSDQVRTMVETRPLLETVARGIAQTLGATRVATLLDHGGAYTPAHALGYGDAPPPVRFAANGPIAVNLAELRRPLRIYFDDAQSWANKHLDSAAERGALTDLGSELLLPLAVKNKLLGFLSLGPRVNEAPYTGSEVRLLESVAIQTGLALENARLTEAVAHEAAQRERMHRELEIAREVQETLYPRPVAMPAGLAYAGRCRPAQSVGGDYYDFFEIPGGEYGVAIGDISGKGIPAALLMASLQASLRGLTYAGSPQLAPMMANLNKLIHASSPSNKYATFFYGQYDPTGRRMIYVNGGHCEPMVFRADGAIERLAEGGAPIGLFGPAKYTQAEVEMAAGDLLVAFTDGISEAMNAADEEFGEDRLIEVVRSAGAVSPGELIDRIFAACDAFAAGAPQHDDMTVVVLKWS